MASIYYQNLIRTVLDASKGTTWEEAVREWEIIDCEEDENCAAACICGKERIRYLYTIQNVHTGICLYPIGSSCIKKFDRDDLAEETTIREQMFKLLHAVHDRKFIELSSEYFSRKLLCALYERGAFQPSQYNHFNPRIDYEFLLDMFNKRDKSSISQKQQSKIRGIIVGSIKPYLARTLKFKSK